MSAGARPRRPCRSSSNRRWRRPRGSARTLETRASRASGRPSGPGGRCRPGWRAHGAVRTCSARRGSGGAARGVSSQSIMNPVRTRRPHSCNARPRRRRWRRGCSIPNGIADATPICSGVQCCAARREIWSRFRRTIHETGSRCRRRLGKAQRIVGATDARSRRFGADLEVRIRPAGRPCAGSVWS